MNQEDDCFNDDRQPFQNQMPKAITLTDHSYSLEIDMLTGWVPKIESCKLLALNFVNQVNDEIIAKAITDGRLMYLGFRPQDTGQLHKQYSNSATYSYKQSKALIRKPQIPFLGMNPSIESAIQFNSIFESGNLDVVIRKNDKEYDLFMRVDSNTKGHTSWYNFEVKGLKKGEKIQLNICNLAKSRSLYERGMRPYIWRSSKQEWLQGGENVQYATRVQLTKIYNCLSFTISGECDNDLIKIAYCAPYTYSQMLDWCNKLVQKCNFVEKTIFCESVSGVTLPLLTFSDGLVINKKCLILQARIHPGESNGSWMMQGLLEYLASPNAKQLLSKCIVKVVPMMNPDGVILGNYRTGVAGRDLNRRFKLTDKTLFPSVFAMKQLVKEQYSIFGENLIGFIDLHGHSVKKNVFLYGPEFTLWNYNYYKCRLLAKLLSQKTEMFRFYSSIFRISQQKRSTARGVFAELYDLINCFTIEASNGSYYNSTQTYDFTTQNWIKMGNHIGECLSELIDMQMEMDFIYGMKSEELKRTNRQVKNNIINKRRSFTGHQEDLCQQQFQNTKFAKLFEEIKLDAEKMNQSFSEGGSDSESSDDDYSETQLDDIKEQIQDIATKQKTKDRPSVSILQPAVRSKIPDSRFSPRGQKSQQPSQQSILLSMQQSEKRLNIPRSAQNSVLKKSSINTQSSKPNRITNYVSGQQSATIEYKEDQVPNHPLQQLLHQTMTRPSTAKLDEIDDENFFPIQGFTSSHYNVFKRHTRLRSNLTLNRKVKEKKSQPQATPPLLQQMGINLKTQVNTQTNFESLGLKVKPKHFLAPKKQEEPSLNDFSKSQNMIVDMQTSTRPPKPNVPPSFYSVKRHMMLRLKN